MIAVDAGTDGALPGGAAVPGAVDLRPLGRRGDLVESDALSPGDVERLLDGGGS